MSTYGTCVAKAGSLTTLTVYVKSDSAIPGGYSYSSLQTCAGTVADPFWYLSDAISKAYEIGAPYNSATVTIYLLEGTGADKHIHYIRPLKNTERQYIPANFDYQ